MKLIYDTLGQAQASSIVKLRKDIHLGDMPTMIYVGMGFYGTRILSTEEQSHSRFPGLIRLLRETAAQHCGRGRAITRTHEYTLHILTGLPRLNTTAASHICDWRQRQIQLKCSLINRKRWKREARVRRLIATTKHCPDSVCRFHKSLSFPKRASAAASRRFDISFTTICNVISRFSNAHINGL